MEKETLYFVAIIPPEAIQEQINAFRLDFADRFNSRAAMRIIPHITLKAPFKLKPALHSDPVRWFRALTFQQVPFRLALQDFGVFNKKRHPVVFVKPVLDAPLSLLQQAIIRSFRLAYLDIAIAENELRFHPHITIAYRDLSYEHFTAAWKEYQLKQYREAFMVDSFALLQHDGRKWNVQETHPVQ